MLFFPVFCSVPIYRRSRIAHKWARYIFANFDANPV